MQPFISWSSRTSGPSTCSLSAALLSTTAPTPIIPAAALDVGPNSKLFRRFGDFYKRFYSTVSEDGKSAAFTHDKRNICGSGSISGSTGGSFYSPPGTESKPRSSSFSQGGVRPGLIRHCRQTPDGIHQDIATNRKFKPPTLGLRFPSGKPRDGFRPYKRRELGPVPPKPSGEDWEESSKSPIPSFRYPSMITLREESVAIGRALAYTLPESSRPPDSVEASVHQLVKRLEDHDRLVRALEWEIGRRHYLIQAAPSEEEETGHLEELQSLQKIYTHISRFYYDETGGEMAMRAVEASRNSVASGPFPSRAYIPPFPHYRTFDPPVALNKSLLNLFHPIAPPPKYLLKISYNLLTSPSPPDLKSYNIMIRGFTLFRQSSLAQIGRAHV